jgi:hypothetical protein
MKGELNDTGLHGSGYSFSSHRLLHTPDQVSILALAMFLRRSQTKIGRGALLESNDVVALLLVPSQVFTNQKDRVVSHDAWTP